MRIYVLGLLFLSFMAPAANDEKEQQPIVTENSKLSLQQACDKRYPDGSNAVLTDCIKQLKIERITVHGSRYIGLESSGIAGRFHLDKKFIDQSPRTTGDINDLIALLPGVDLSDSAFSVAALKDVRAQEISISGAKPWQTGFFLDGMNYNSRQDPSGSSTSVSSINDVQGAPQAYNINSEIVQSIDVYDNNIPAEYGDFSGGIVSVNSVSAFDKSKSSMSFGYRGTQSNWGQYRVLDGEASESEEPVKPEFEKNAYNLNFSHQFNQHHGIVFSGSYVDSISSDISLEETAYKKRHSSNLLFKYSMRDLWVDNLDWSFIYAPYQNEDYLKNVLNSGLTIEGGGYGSTLNIRHRLANSDISSKLQFNASDNSRTAPDHYYIWRQINGKEWGQLSTNNSDKSPYSLAGGNGSLKKQQQTISWKNKLSLDSITFGGGFHDIEIGFGIQHERLQRQRANDSYHYNSARQYSTLPGEPVLNCSGYQLDCVELTFFRPIADIEAELGYPIDSSSQIYTDNIATAPQYFESRIVYSAEDINVSLTKFNAHLTDNIEWGDLKLNLGLRVDYDQFFKNVNIAPRTSLGYDVFSDQSSLLILGLSRYYDAGLLTYKVKEQQTPYYIQYRDINNLYLQGWKLSSNDSDHRFRYQDVKTPYNNEFVLGWTQSLADYGQISLKWVTRRGEEQLRSADSPFFDTDGYWYDYQVNGRRTTSDRISLSWSAKFDNHSVWANTSHSESTTSSDSLNTDIQNSNIDDLVVYNGNTITQDQLDFINSGFGYPLSVKFGINSQWSDTLNSSVTATYTAAHDEATATDNYAPSVSLDNICSECESTEYALSEYVLVAYPARTTFNASINWSININPQHKFNLRADITNLLNSRTHSVSEGNSGIEVGRQFWLSLKYHIN